jgi:hypothetical protein
METYIQVSFWIGVAALVINMLLIAAVDYPKAKMETLGQKIFQIIIGGAFVVWSGFLLFGN